MKVDKPAITPVNLNRENESEFCKTIENETVQPIEPVFIDFKEKISTTEIAPGVQFDYITNLPISYLA
jgi:hypothetical protein